MMLNYILLFLQIILLMAGGYLLANLLIEREHFIEKLFLGFLMNLGIFTFMWFLLNLAGVPFNRLSALILISLLFLIYNMLNILKHKKLSLKYINLKLFNFTRFTFVERFMIISLIILILSSLLNNLYWPVKDWDSLALYDFRAIVFTKTGFVSAGIPLGYFFQYPLFTSLLHTLVYVDGLMNPMFLYTLLYAAFLVCFYFSLRKFVSRPGSLFWTLVTATIPLIFEHSTIAYTNLPYTIFIVLAMIYFYRYTINRNIGLIIISSILLSICSWVRYTEPFWMGLVFISVIYTLIKRKFYHLLAYLMIFFASKYIWQGYLSSIQFGSNSLESAIPTAIETVFKQLNFSQLYATSTFLYKNILSSWIELFIIFIVISIYNFIKGLSRRHNIFALMVFVQVGILVGGIYIFSMIFPGWSDIPDSALRMSMFFPPLFIYYIALKL